ncbi:electron transfer flavoprotein subunit beta/FixA family protein [Sphingobacterium sp. UT-1RO-CII-1]|uniref:electron transfer flavoprotein subunit beta/FixA family protein n=1 Tax=Sphingobacterium sp. UT-1RO-CII-1 TaxID=2995225 RepID=UPI00227BF41F|nr:electron transfer flavoprotein subunit beta/FixA family protein [Sphingobacterium sp. UT-1RO-CII-1]MCY4780100.1 electron transfer flavoprotein subunit beta/FixA family protein [Sphingobacterium sp. UT-1RO-CII-1]
MKILVCISNVPDTTSKITFTDNNTAFNSNGIQYIINPYDELALSKAVELADGGKANVTVIHVGDVASEPTIRKALAVGADQAVRIDAPPRDAWFVANQIATYAKTENFDLILTGRESIDYNGAQVQAYIAELLQIPSVSIAKRIEINGNEATIDREIEGGKEVLTVNLPVVIGTAEGVAEVKIPNMRGIMGARSKPLTVLPAVDVPALSTISNYETPTPRGAVTLIDKDNINKLVELLHTEAKVI